MAPSRRQVVHAGGCGLLLAAGAVQAVAGSGWLALLMVAVFVPLAFPLLLSHLAGGWVVEYTSRRRWLPRDIPSQHGKTAVVTGSTSGLGLHMATELARAGARVVVCGRSQERARAVAVKVAAAAGPGAGPVEGAAVELSSIGEAVASGQRLRGLVPHLDILVLNAGVHSNFGNSTTGFAVTADGFEHCIGICYLAHVALVEQVRDLLSPGARVVALSSMAEQTGPECGIEFDWWKPDGGRLPPGYTDGMVYGATKLASALYAETLAEQLAPQGVWVCSCHPGVVTTGLQRGYRHSDAWKAGKTGLALLGRWYRKTSFGLAEAAVEVGAQTQLFCATSPEAPSSPSGTYFKPIGRPATLGHPRARDPALRTRLHAETRAALRPWLALP